MTRIIINTLCREEITKCYNPVSTACCHCFLSEPPTYDTESRSHTPNPGAGDLGDQSYPPPNICTRRGKQDWLTLQAFVGGFFFFPSLFTPFHVTPPLFATRLVLGSAVFQCWCRRRLKCVSCFVWPSEVAEAAVLLDFGSSASDKSGTVSRL